MGFDIYWKLKTIDALKADKGTNIPTGEHRHLVDTLIENGQIREIFVKRLSLLLLSLVTIRCHNT